MEEGGFRSGRWIENSKGAQWDSRKEEGPVRAGSMEFARVWNLLVAKLYWNFISNIKHLYVFGNFDIGKTGKKLVI